MRVNAKWTPSGMILWLIAAGIATLVVCRGAREAEPPRPAPTEVEFEVEMGD
ncbi:MAG: hypothetical protein AAGF92_22585 [Myxococcota bacterium]